MPKDLLYQPDLSYKKNYYTSGKVTENDISAEVGLNSDEAEKNHIETKQDKIEELFDKIDGVMQITPNIFINTFLVPYIITKDVMNKLSSDVIPELPDFTVKEELPDWSVVLPEVDAPIIADEVSDDPFGTVREPKLPTQDLAPDLTSSEKQEVQYVEDLEDIIYDYSLKLWSVLESNLQSLLTYHSLSSQSNLVDITTKNLKDQNLSHMSDYLTKSSITLEQKMRLYSKMYTVDQTIFHFKSVKISNEQVKRYKENSRVPNRNVLSKISNSILKESVIVAEKKYEENFYALYKYLNSSVILLDECMNVSTKQKSALVFLNNEERGK